MDDAGSPTSTGRVLTPSRTPNPPLRGDAGGRAQRIFEGLERPGKSESSDCSVWPIFQSVVVFLQLPNLCNKLADLGDIRTTMNVYGTADKKRAGAGFGVDGGIRLEIWAIAQSAVDPFWGP